MLTLPFPLPLLLCLNVLVDCITDVWFVGMVCVVAVTLLFTFCKANHPVLLIFRMLCLKTHLNVSSIDHLNELAALQCEPEVFIIFQKSGERT